MTELQLIQRTRDGDTSAFADLVRLHQSGLFRVVQNLVPDRHAVEDLAQDVFLAAYRNLSRYDAARGSFRAWLFTIARNRCVNHGKRERLRKHDAIDDVSDHRNRGESLEQQEFFQQLDIALMELPFEQRAAFVLIELEQLSYQEAAQVEQTEVGTIKSRVHRAKKKLKSSLASFACETRNE